MKEKKTRVLLEMRPALEGFAGIPQEVRLLFRGLKKIDSLEVEGMIQTSNKILTKGMPTRRWFKSNPKTNQRLNRYSRVIISIAERPFQTLYDRIYGFFQRQLYTSTLTVQTLLFGHTIRLSAFDSTYFEDFIWRTLFSKTLPSSDYSLVSRSGFRINSVPWKTMHMVGLNTLNLRPSPKYPRLDTADFDVFIGQTPYPATLTGRAKLVIRYHDAIPIFMPHTIPEKSTHQATHYYALLNNVRSGAWFSCVSETTRQDLLRLFPEAEKRSVTIHNMVSHHYFDHDSAPELVPQIIRSRLYEGVDQQPSFFSLREKEAFYKKHLSGAFRYLLIVSTIEPRKNHTRLLAGWEVIKSDIDPNLKLVVVGTLGWDNDQILRGMRSWIDRGELFLLNAVPAPDLRVLYKHAAATVCPSLGEGFDFSGAEAMASGGLTVASDIPVHREIYDNAAEYFDPYSTISLVQALKKVLYDANHQDCQKQMIMHGQIVSEKYKPERIIPLWSSFLNRLTTEN